MEKSPMLTNWFDQACYLMSLPFVAISVLATGVAYLSYKVASVLHSDWNKVYEEAKQEES